MRTFQDLLNTVNELKKESCVWHPELPENIRSQYEAHNQHVLNRLEKILSDSIASEEKIKKLRDFLYMRGMTIIGSSICYTRHIKLPANIACVLIAHSIAHDDESIVKILFPTVQKVIGWFPPENVKAATEEDDRFDPCAFLVNSDGDALLSAPDIFQHAISNTDVLFQSSDTDKKSEFIFDLTRTDNQLLKSFLGDESEKLYQTLLAAHLIRHNEKPSVGVRLRDLKNALLQSSIAGTGSDMLANENEYVPAIKIFYELFRSWSLDLKSRFVHLSVLGCSDPLNTYLLYLFARVPGAVLTEDEINVIHECHIPINCAQLIGNYIDNFLKQHLFIFDISLTAEGSELLENTLSDPSEIPSSNAFHQLYQSFLKKLKTRPVILGDHDVNCVKKLFYFSSLVDGGLASICTKIHCVTQLSYSLSMIPTNDWNQFSEQFSFEFPMLFRPFRSSADRGNSPFVVIFNLLPEMLWKKFFDIFYLKIKDFFTYKDLKHLFFMMPEHKYCRLIHSMDDFHENLFPNGDIIGRFFNEIDFECWQKLMIIFKKIIVKIMSNAFNFGICMLIIPPENQGIFLQRLNELDESIVKNALKGQGKLSRVLDFFEKNKRFLFLSTLGDSFESFLTHWYELSMILSVTPVSCWSNICVRLLDEKAIQRLIPNVSVLIEFLEQFQVAQQKSFLSAIAKYLPVLLKNYDDIHQVISKFSILEGFIFYAMRYRLPYLITELFKQYFDHTKNQLPMSESEKYLMTRLLWIGVPVLFSAANVQKFFANSSQYASTFFISSENQSFSKLIKKIDKINALKDNSTESLGLLRFLSCCEFVLNNEAQTLRGGFYNVLIRTFGKEFFQLVHQYFTELQRTTVKNELPTSSVALQLH